MVLPCFSFLNFLWQAASCQILGDFMTLCIILHWFSHLCRGLCVCLRCFCEWFTYLLPSNFCYSGGTSCFLDYFHFFPTIASMMAQSAFVLNKRWTAWNLRSLHYKKSWQRMSAWITYNKVLDKHTDTGINGKMGTRWCRQPWNQQMVQSLLLFLWEKFRS